MHVVPQLTLSGTSTGQRSARCANGIPKAGLPWYFNSGGNSTGGYPAVRTELTGPARAAMLDEALLAILVRARRIGPLVLVKDGDIRVLYNPRLRRALPHRGRYPVLLVDEAREVDEDEHARLMARSQPAASQ